MVSGLAHGDSPVAGKQRIDQAGPFEPGCEQVAKHLPGGDAKNRSRSAGSRRRRVVAPVGSSVLVARREDDEIDIAGGEPIAHSPDLAREQSSRRDKRAQDRGECLLDLAEDGAAGVRVGRGDISDLDSVDEPWVERALELSPARPRRPDPAR